MARQMNPVNWFEIPVDDMDRAKAFYEYVLGTEISLNDMGPLKMGWFPMQQDVPGSTGSLVQGNSYKPSHAGTMVYFTVESIEQALARVTEKGGKVLSPKTSIGEFGFVATFEDSEGNRIALHAVQ